jgi:hypothetical protein
MDMQLLVRVAASLGLQAKKKVDIVLVCGLDVRVYLKQ